MSLVGFEAKISAGERPKTYALDQMATRTGLLLILQRQNFLLRHQNFVKFAS